MAKTHTYSRRVEFRDTDAAGIVHFSVFFAYMEEAEHDFWRSLGTSVVHRESDRKISWPRVAARCDYQVAIRFEQIVEIEVRVEKIGTKSLSFGFIFKREDETVARGSVTTVCCEIAADRQMTSIRIPDDLRQRIEPYVG